MVLSIVLSRIYVLRNQLVHGGATWGSSVNREQLRDCTNFMAKLVPLVIETMMDHPETLWGQGVLSGGEVERPRGRKWEADAGCSRPSRFGSSCWQLDLPRFRGRVAV